MKYISILVLFLISQVVLAQSPFCTPNFTGGNNVNLCINKFELSSYTTGTGSEGNAADNYQDNSSVSAGELCAGATYKLKLNVQRSIFYVDNPGGPAYIHAWVDWNNDGVLTGEGEAFNLGEVATSTTAGGGLIEVNGTDPLASIPADVEFDLHVPSHVSGEVYMRVAVIQSLSQTSCDQFNIGEMEDFKVSVTNYGSLNYDFLEVSNLDSIDVSVTTTIPTDPISWEFLQNGQFAIQNALSGQSSIKYKPGKELNIVRAFGPRATCLLDTSGLTNAYTNNLSVVKIGNTDINVDQSSVCLGDSVNTSIKYRNELTLFENASVTTVAPLQGPVESVINVDKGDVLDHTSLNKVCINFTTDYMNEMSFVLQSPSGKRAILSVRNGDDDLTPGDYNFCFSDSAGLDFINGYSAALNDTFTPAQSLNTFNRESQQGDWSLYSYSDYFYGTYVLNSWSLEFGHQSFEGWNSDANYEDASLDSAKTQVNADSFFKANFNSYYGSASDSVHVMVVPSEDVKMDKLTMDVTNVCPGASSVFRSTLATGHSNVYYDWYLNGELQEGEHEDTVLISGLNDGDVVKVIADMQNLCNTSKDSLTISVIGQTFQDAELSVNQNKEFPLCENEDLLVAVEIVNGDPNYSSEWLVNNVSVSQNSSTYNWMNVSNNDSLIYHYTQTNACGKVQSFSDTIVFEGIVREDLNTVMNMNDGVVFCQNQNVSFYVDVNDPNMSATYTWLLDGDDLNNNTSEFESNSLNVGGHTIDVIYEPNGGCYNQQSSVSTVNFAIDPLRNTELEIGGNVEFCPNDLLVFTIKDSANLGAGALYSWKENGIDLPNETSSSITVLNPVAGNTYALEAISEVNCATPAIVISNELTVVETKLKSLSADFDDAIEAEYCEKSQFVNSAILNGDAILSSAQWNVNGTKQAEGSDIDYELTSGLTTIEFVFDYDNGCGVIETGSISETFEVFAPADTVFQVLQNSTEYAVQLTNAFNEANTSYQWLLNGEFLSNDAEPVFELINEGSYTLCMSTNRGDSKICPSEKCLEFIYIGIDDADFSNTIELFPNPATNQLNVSGVFASEVEYKILNVQGQTVLDGRLKMDEKGIELNQLQSGAYQIVIVANKKVGIKRFVKM
tara:strand:- start:1214 stop:4588 length:3375 start_codon:yes stop_codon:yes gene_type:complete